MKALVLAGGFPQIDLLNELRDRGISTVLADYYAEPVAKPYADKFYQVSTLDVEAITNVAKSEKVDFLITVCTDQALLTVAKVSEELGLPCYIDYQTGLNVTNKSYMKKVFAENAIPSAKHVIMGVFDENKLAGMKYPMIVKPVDCNSSKGVAKVVCIEELISAFDKAVGYSRTKTAIVEEFVDGTELSVDVYVEQGKAHVLSVTNSDKIQDNQKFVIFRSKYPIVRSEVVNKKISDASQRIADAFGIKNSPMLIQLIVRDEDIFILEFSARTGGGVKHRLIERICGFDVIKAVVDLTLGEIPHLEIKPPQSRYIVDEFIYCRPGVFDRLEGFDSLVQDGILSNYFLFKWSGAVFDTIENSGDRIAGFTIQADSIEDLKKKHCIANSRIKAIDNNGEDMIRHDLLTNIEYDFI